MTAEAKNCQLWNENQNWNQTFAYTKKNSSERLNIQLMKEECWNETLKNYCGIEVQEENNMRKPKMGDTRSEGKNDVKVDKIKNVIVEKDL